MQTKPSDGSRIIRATCSQPSEGKHPFGRFPCSQPNEKSTLPKVLYNHASRPANSKTLYLQILPTGEKITLFEFYFNLKYTCPSRCAGGKSVKGGGNVKIHSC